jgi:ABC-type antimicrobial peptide transport system permease subunit
VVSTRGRPELAFPTLAGAVHSLDRDLPLFEVRSMDQVVAASMLPWKGTAAGLVGMAGLALVLAVLGLYGVLAYVVGTRVGEIAVRRALGATGSDLASLVLSQAGKLVAAGIAGGLLVSLALGRLVERLLVGVAALDPLSYVLVTVVLSAAALAAAVMPVLRALRVDPAGALRLD